MIRALIIDDEIQAINNLETLLASHPQVRILEKITDSQRGPKAVAEFKPDLLFLDVQMPGKDGFEVVRLLHEMQLRPDIIFVTAFNSYAIQAIRHAAFDFLLKPVDPAELDATLRRFESRLLQKSDERYHSLLETIPPHGKIKFTNGNGFILVRPEDIIYITADWNYAEIFQSDEKSEMVTTNLGAIEKIIPSSIFYRVNRSTIINLAYLTRINRRKRTALLIKDGKEYTFKIPLLNIRKMERFLEGQQP